MHARAPKPASSRLRGDRPKSSMNQARSPLVYTQRSNRAKCTLALCGDRAKCTLAPRNQLARACCDRPKSSMNQARSPLVYTQRSNRAKCTLALCGDRAKCTLAPRNQLARACEATGQNPRSRPKFSMNLFFLFTLRGAQRPGKMHARALRQSGIQHIFFLRALALCEAIGRNARSRPQILVPSTRQICGATRFLFHLSPSRRGSLAGR